jgi:hypothetical protein
MAELLLDERYITVDGRKIILIYRPSLLPDRPRLFETWRARAEELGIGEILICNAMTFGEFDPRDLNCDAAVEFPPHTVSTMEQPLSELGAPASFTGKVYDYVDAVRSSLGKTYDFPYFPAVMPRWDNTPRKGPRGHIFNKSSPEAFEVWLRDAASRARRSEFAEPIVFINSWNEWAEGAHLEPDSRYGRAFLEAVRRVASSEPISTQIRSNPDLLDCLSRQELEQAVKESATHVQLLATLHRSEMVYSGLQHTRSGIPVEAQGASENPPESLLVIGKDIRFSLFSGRHATLGQYAPQGFARAHLQQVESGSIRSLAAGCRGSGEEGAICRADRFHQLLERVGRGRSP